MGDSVEMAFLIEGLTVPQRLGTMKSLGSLSVNAIKLWKVLVSTDRLT